MKTIASCLAETDVKVIGSWPSEMRFFDDPRAAKPEPRLNIPRPTEYFAPTTAFGPLTTRGSWRDIKPLTTEEWFTIQYHKSRWNKK